MRAILTNPRREKRFFPLRVASRIASRREVSPNSRQNNRLKRNYLFCGAPCPFQVRSSHFSFALSIGR